MVDDWRQCDQCIGACIVGVTSCLAHASAEEQAAALERFSKTGEIDVRGVTITVPLLRRIFDAGPQSNDGDRVFSDAKFTLATFETEAWFDRVTFKGNSLFDGATFKGSAGFSEVTFEGDVRFRGATFSGNATFNQATFTGDATFNEATFTGDVRFNQASFSGDATFSQATFTGDVRFNQASFSGDATFGRASFSGGVVFDQATFSGDAWFDGTTFSGDAWFGRAIFSGNAWFGRATFSSDARFTGATFQDNMPELSLVVEGTLDMDEVQFATPIRIKATAAVFVCRGARFLGGVRLDVHRAFVQLDDSDLSAPSLLTGPTLSGSAPADERPKLLSLQRANVAGLTLGNIDLATCRFGGSHNLDKLRLEADTIFGLSPAVTGWERRQVIAEESAWRAARRRPRRWVTPVWPYLPSLHDQSEPLSPGVIASLYRALRKGREDAKDEPGAADFYYGEMEMRRHDHGAADSAGPRGRATRSVLFAYWLVSGYGLRAWRSAVALAVVTALFAAAFYFVGFTKPPEPASYWTSLLYAFRSTISLTDIQVTLTAWGSFFQTLLRITGPVLLGLTLLALRGRIKR
jgi:uncharacterized protein YjbI with pentapeptide repeats